MSTATLRELFPVLESSILNNIVSWSNGIEPALALLGQQAPVIMLRVGHSSVDDLHETHQRLRHLLDAASEGKTISDVAVLIYLNHLIENEAEVADLNDAIARQPSLVWTHRFLSWLKASAVGKDLYLSPIRTSVRSQESAPNVFGSAKPLENVADVPNVTFHLARGANSLFVNRSAVIKTQIEAEPRVECFSNESGGSSEMLHFPEKNNPVPVNKAGLVNR